LVTRWSPRRGRTGKGRTASPDCKPSKGLRAPQALFFGQISRWPICHFSAMKSPEKRASTSWNRGDRFSVSRVRIEFPTFPACPCIPLARTHRFPCFQPSGSCKSLPVLDLRRSPFLAHSSAIFALSGCEPANRVRTEVRASDAPDHSVQPSADAAFNRRAYIAGVQTANPANLGLHPDAIEAPRSRPPVSDFGQEGPLDWFGLLPEAA
jgi:hypothetical protein